MWPELKSTCSSDYMESVSWMNLNAASSSQIYSRASLTVPSLPYTTVNSHFSVLLLHSFAQLSVCVSTSKKLSCWYSKCLLEMQQFAFRQLLTTQHSRVILFKLFYLRLCVLSCELCSSASCLLSSVGSAARHESLMDLLPSALTGWFFLPPLVWLDFLSVWERMMFLMLLICTDVVLNL